MVQVVGGYQYGSGIYKTYPGLLFHRVQYSPYSEIAHVEGLLHHRGIQDSLLDELDLCQGAVKTQEAYPADRKSVV